MKITKFNGSIWKTGNGAVVTVPMAYLKNNLLKEGVVYTFEVCEEDGEAQN